MRISWRLTALLLIGGLTLVMLTACPKMVETTPKGPGGLPTGTGEESGDTGNIIPDAEKDLPIYPGSIRTGPATYETGDSLETVKNHYAEVLGVAPMIHGNYGEVTAFVTSEGEVILYALTDKGGGTQIRFSQE